MFDVSHASPESAGRILLPSRAPGPPAARARLHQHRERIALPLRLPFGFAAEVQQIAKALHEGPIPMPADRVGRRPAGSEPQAGLISDSNARRSSPAHDMASESGRNASTSSPPE